LKPGDISPLLDCPAPYEPRIRLRPCLSSGSRSGRQPVHHHRGDGFPILVRHRRLNYTQAERVFCPCRPPLCLRTASLVLVTLPLSSLLPRQASTTSPLLSLEYA